MINELLAKRMITEAQELVEDILMDEFSQAYKDCMTAYVAATLLNKVAEDHYPHQDVRQSLITILQTVPVTLSSKQISKKQACMSIFLDDVNFGGQLFYSVRKELHYGSQQMSTKEVPNLNVLCHENNHLLNSCHEEIKETKTKGKKQTIVLIRTGLSKMIYMPHKNDSVVENNIVEEVLNERESQKNIRTIKALANCSIQNLDIKQVLTHQDPQFQSPYQSSMIYLRNILPQIESQAQQARYFGSVNQFIRKFENKYQTSFKDFSKLVDQFHTFSTGTEIPIKMKRKTK